MLTSLLFVEWEVRPSTWQPGDQADIIISPISIDWQNMDVVSTIIQNSELIHQIVMDVAFIQTKEGLKSFNDLGATTVLA